MAFFKLVVGSFDLDPDVAVFSFDTLWRVPDSGAPCLAYCALMNFEALLCSDEIRESELPRSTATVLLALASIIAGSRRALLLLCLDDIPNLLF